MYHVKGTIDCFECKRCVDLVVPIEQGAAKPTVYQSRVSRHFHATSKGFCKGSLELV